MTAGLDRRAFLRNAGMTALVGAAGAGSPISTAAATWAAPGPNGRFDFDETYSRIGTDSIKWDQQIAKYGKDKIAVGMGIADMDFRVAPCITKALAERCKHELWGYLDTPDSYIESIVQWNKRRYGVDIDPETVVLTTGVHPGLIAALETFSPPGTRVLLTTPTYNGFYGDLRHSRTIAEDSPMSVVDGKYSIDFDDFERRARQVNTFILCNPQNPTGNCWSPEDLTRLGEICLRHRVVLLADEIHCDFVTKGQKYTPFASLPNKDIVNNSLTFKAVSKTFGLAAMKAAYFYSTNPDYLERVKENNRADLSTLGMVANRAAMMEGDDWIDQLLPYIDRNHDLVESFLGEKVPLVKYRKAEGTYLAWLDVSAVIERIGAIRTAADESRTTATTVTPTMVAEKWFVEHAHVQLNPGHTYGTGGEACMRMNIATSRKLVELALNNIAAAVARL
jgi:cystathionine beta-lyase